MSIADNLSAPWALALFGLCAIAMIVAAVFFGIAAAERDRANRSTPMRTANSRLIDRQARKLQRAASPKR